MNQSYARIKDIESLGQFLDHIKGVRDKNNLIVFFDWDDTLVNPDTDQILEPEVTRDLFDYLLKNRIYFAVITGRFYNSACDDNERDLEAMQENIDYTMLPTLRKLGVNTDTHSGDVNRKNIYKVHNEKGRCVGVLYMGIFFTGEKGATIKHYIRQQGLENPEVLFIDDYEPYLKETTSSFPQVKAFRRIVPEDRL